ncbi:MAG: hypothetical protein E3K37_15785 [Candidatus Kuenenia sp.]|nr:hypothetical protein [Candidatus Kuenenia hertensis]
MAKIVLEEKVKFSQQSYLSDILFKSDNAQLELLCLEEGQEVVPHAENFQVIILVISGRGSLTQGTDVYDLKPDSVIIFEGTEPCGIKACGQLVLVRYVIPSP